MLKSIKMPFIWLTSNYLSPVVYRYNFCEIIDFPLVRICLIKVRAKQERGLRINRNPLSKTEYEVCVSYYAGVTIVALIVGAVPVICSNG